MRSQPIAIVYLTRTRALAQSSHRAVTAITYYLTSSKCSADELLRFAMFAIACGREAVEGIQRLSLSLSLLVMRFKIEPMPTGEIFRPSER